MTVKINTKDGQIELSDDVIATVVGGSATEILLSSKTVMLSEIIFKHSERETTQRSRRNLLMVSLRMFTLLWVIVLKLVRASKNVQERVKFNLWESTRYQGWTVNAYVQNMSRKPSVWEIQQATRRWSKRQQHVCKQAEYVTPLNVFPCTRWWYWNKHGNGLWMTEPKVADRPVFNSWWSWSDFIYGLWWVPRRNWCYHVAIVPWFGQSIKDKTELDGQDLAHAFQAGALKLLYKAVMKPVEGK